MPYDISNGNFTQISNPLLERLAELQLSGAGFRLILFIIRNSYGYKRKWTRHESVRKIGRDIKMTSSSVGLAIQVLIENGILEKNGKGELCLNKSGIASVRETGHLRASEKLDKSVRETGQSVRETGQSVRETGHPLIIRKENLKENSKERETYPEAFILFWKAYPRKTGKDKALESWKKKSPPLADCLTALEWQRNQSQWVKDSGQFIPHPTTWINQGRWNDEPIKASAGSSSAPIPGKYDGIGEKA